MPSRTVIFVGILEEVVDDMNRVIWQPQMDGGKVARELPCIVDQVLTMSLFTEDPGASPDAAGTWRHDPDKGNARRLVCQSGNSFGLPGKNRSGRLDRAARSRRAPHQHQPTLERMTT